ncbi:hypothetical protein I3760_02G032600 [Carya illinoinensis]|nr:hypothetical protein I3760_02G032600 [Carya illinoinensis]
MGWKRGERKLHLVNWKKVTTPVSCGGLGVRNLKIFNKALLGKWLWRYNNEDTALWKQIVDAKYGRIWGNWCTNEIKGVFGVGLWKSIRKGWGDFVRNTNLKVGTGSNISFWHDVWCGDLALKLAFPRLFRIATCKGAAVADSYLFTNNMLNWNVDFSRDLQDWEVSEAADFYAILYASKIDQTRDDMLQWTHDSKSRFSVKSYYKILTSLGNITFPWKCIWKAKVPSKVAFFGWLVSLEKVLTTDNLRKRGFYVMDWCTMCKNDGESVNHLFLHCEMATTLWNELFVKLGIVWVMPFQVVDFLVCWQGAADRNIEMDDHCAYLVSMAEKWRF